MLLGTKGPLTHRRRLAIKAGITCLWQISGRSEIDFSGQVQLDVDYIERLSQALNSFSVAIYATRP